jgi:hypothetical protein
MIWTAYHGCDLSLATAVTTHGVRLGPSMGQHEWLGTGVYFFVDGKQRAIEWAQKREAAGKIAHAAVLSATIDSGHCLNLTDAGAVAELKAAFLWLALAYARAGCAMPMNSKHHWGVPVDRKLDCAVIDAVHQLRRMHNRTPYDTVLGAFQDGPEAFPGSAIRAKDHIQVAVSYNSYGRIVSNVTLCWQR